MMIKRDERDAGSASVFLVVLVCSLGLALVVAWQGKETRRHFEVSLRPHLDLFLTPEFDGRFSLAFDNAGAGPALIREYTITINGQEYSEKDVSSGKWTRDQPIGDLQIQTSWLQPGDSLVVGRRRSVLSIPLGSPKELYDRFVSILDGVQVRIRYSSLYGEEFVAEWEMNQAHAALPDQPSQRTSR